MTDVYAAVEAVAADGAFATAAVCDTLAVSRSAYSAWRDGEDSPRDEERATLTERITAIFWQHQC